MVMTTLDLNETWTSNDEDDVHTLGEVKESLLGFYRQYEFTRKAVTFTRAALYRGEMRSDDYLDNTTGCGCIIGQAYRSIGYNPHDEGSNFLTLLNGQHFLFEEFILYTRPGMTPETNEQLAQLDVILALVEEEL